MTRKKLLLISFVTILFIALIHYFALKLSWYYIFRWLDTPMHILGGFWVTMTSLWLYSELNHAEIILRKSLITKIMIFSVLLIGIIWEIFEVKSGNADMRLSNYWSDTIVDIASGFMGGLIAEIYYLK